MKRTLTDFLSRELLFEHLRTIYRHYLDTGGYDRTEMVTALVEYLSSPEGSQKLVDGLSAEEAELLYVLRQVGGIAPRRWLCRELASRGNRSANEWKRVLWGLRKRHLIFQIGSDTAYLPEGMSNVLGRKISGEPQPLESDVIPGPSAVRQSVHGLVIALLSYLHQDPPRVMAEEERMWKRDLQGMADFFHSYLFEPSGGGGSIKVIRGRLSRVVELLLKMGFLEKRGKRLYVVAANWSDWAQRPEVERQSLLLSFLKDHYENISVALEAMVDWKEASWIPLARLTESVRYRALCSAFHVLRVRPQAEIRAKSPGRGWVAACVHLLADLGLAYTGTDVDGEPVARATDGGIEAWDLLHDGKAPRRRSRRERTGPSAYAQPNFELLIPEECSPSLHREIGAIAELRSLDRFWTYVLTSRSTARGVEEGLSGAEILERLDALVTGTVPPNVRDAVAGWASTAWWVSLDADKFLLQAEAELLQRITAMDGLEDLFVLEDHALRPLVPREKASRWLEERGIRVVADDVDPPDELGPGGREAYRKALEAWERRIQQGGEGPPSGSTWDDVIPVEPLPEAEHR